MNPWSTMMRNLPARRTAALLFLASLAALAGAANPDKDLVAWTDARIKDWQPKPSERRFDEIGWAQDIRTALRLAKKHARPLFLFTMDGRINLGRC
jgi:hypothetical protein